MIKISLYNFYFFSDLDYTVTVLFENGSTISYTVDAAIMSLFIDEPEGDYSVMVAAINSAGVGLAGMPNVERKM